MPLALELVKSLMSRIPLTRYHPLIDRGFGLLYDVERNITWLQDCNFAQTAHRSSDGQMTWDDAMAWVAALSYLGVRSWRMPTSLNPDGSGPCIGDNCTGSELGHLFFGPRTTDPTGVSFINFNPSAKYWTSTEASATDAYAFDFFTLRQGTLPKDPWADPDGLGVPPLTGPVLTWPVHDGDVSSEIIRRLIGFTARPIDLTAHH
jgi:hypothetical protein